MNDKSKETPAKAEAIEIDPRLIGVKEIKEVQINDVATLIGQGWKKIDELNRTVGTVYVMVRY